jgi:hypothetical protein
LPHILDQNAPGDSNRLSQHQGRVRQTGHVSAPTPVRGNRQARQGSAHGERCRAEGDTWLDGAKA